MMLLYIKRNGGFYQNKLFAARRTNRGFIRDISKGRIAKMDIKQALNEEIRRLARKEIKAVVTPLLGTVSALRKQIAEQKRQITALEKRCAAPETAVPAAPVEAEDDDKQVRLNAAGILRLRTKLGLTQGEFAKVLGVAMHTVSVWEQGRRVPRRAHKVRICALRGIGKRELKKMLEQPEAAPAPAEK